MAERRMFSKSVVDSDAFLDMPLSAQALYFHLGMRADDDGFINNPRKIQKMCGSSVDDFKLLFAKKFIFQFNSGIVVVLHWKVHNYIPKDRYKPTLFQDEKNQLSIENGMYTHCIQNADNSETQVRIGKDRLDQIRLDKSREEECVADKPPTRHRFGPYQNVLFTEEELETLKQEFPDWEQRIERLSEYVASTGKKYRSHLATIRSWAKKEEAHGGICQSPAKDESKFARYIGNVV